MRTGYSQLMIIFAALFLCSAHAKTKERTGVSRVGYFNQMYGHIHQNPSRYSQSMSTISCGHPLKVLKLTEPDGKEQVLFSKTWNRVETGPYEGYVPAAFIEDKKPSCFQDRYPKFFESLDLELTQMYYWGRLHDHFDRGHSKVGE